MRAFRAAAMAVLMAPMAMYGLVCIANNGSGDVGVLEDATLAPIAGSPFPDIIPFGGQAIQWMVADSSGSRLYISNDSTQNISVLDTSTFAPIPGSPFPAGGTAPQGMSIYGNTLYVANNGTNTISYFDATTMAQLAGSPVASGGAQPTQALIDPTGTRLYVLNFAAVNVAIFDATVLPLAQVPGSPFAVGPPGARAICLNPSGTLLCATLGDDTLEVRDAMTMLPILGSPFPLGGTGASGVVFSPDGSRVYVANFTSNNVSVLDGTTFAPVPGSPFPTNGLFSNNIFVSPDGTRVYVCNFASNDVSVLDAATLAPILGSPVMSGGTIPIAIAFLTDLFPPTNLSGVQKINDFAVVFERYNLLRWDSSDPAPAGFRIYRNGVLIATLDGAATQYEDHNRTKGISTLYAVVSIDAGGSESAPATVIIN